MGRRLTIYPAPDGENSLWRYKRAKSLWRITWNFIVITLGRYTPWLNVKNAMYRALGMRIGDKTSIGLMAMIDVFWPELVSIGANCIIGYNTTILAHEFLIPEYRTGPVVIGSNVLIGANSTILAGVTIGDNAVIAAGTVVHKDVPPRAMAVGAPMRIIPTQPCDRTAAGGSPDQDDRPSSAPS